jgi:hypothetical protein
VNLLLKVNEDVESTFEVMFQKNQYLYALVSEWYLQMTRVLYEDASPSLFQSMDYAELLQMSRDMIGTFNDFEGNGISLGLVVQQALAVDFGLKLAELLEFYLGRCKAMLDSSECYASFMVKSLNFCDDEFVLVPK